MEYSIRQVSKDDVNEICELWEARLGEKYLDTSRLEKALNPKSETVCLVATDLEDEFLGFAIALVITPPEVTSKINKAEPPTELLKNEKIGLLDTACVKTSAEGEGIGTAFIQALMNHLEKQNVTNFFCISWLRDNHVDSSVIFEKFDFKQLLEIEKYWYNESLEQDYSCPDCGQPCSCTARIYFQSK